MSDEITAKEHLNKFLEIEEKLSEIEIEVPEEIKSILLLNSLSKVFEAFVVAIESRDTLPRLSALKVKILEEADRQISNGPETEQNGVQVFASGQVRQQQVHHKRYSNNNYHNATKNKQHKTCYNCGKPGHFAAQCKNKKEGRKNPVVFITQVQNLNPMRFNLQRKNIWCVDSGATAHLCCDKQRFVNYCEKAEKIQLAGDKFLIAEGYGDVLLKFGNNDILLKNTIYIPSLKNNFISVSKVINNGLTCSFEKNYANIMLIDKVVMQAKESNGLYLAYDNFVEKSNVCYMTKSNNWHDRFGHLHYDALKEMCTKNVVIGLEDVEKPIENCIVCAKNKICVTPFPNVSNYRAKELLELVHSDICGPMRKKSYNGNLYFATFIDDMSRYIFIHFLKSKDQIYEAFIEFKTFSERQTGKMLKALRSDNGREYVSNKFESYLKNSGIKRFLTVPYSPQQNGVAERANRTIVEMARCLLTQAELTEAFWADAVHTAVYLRNRSLTSALNKITPYEAWVGRKPYVSHLRVFGSRVVALNKRHKGKFCEKGEEQIMIGYSDTAKAYRLYNKCTGKFSESRDIIFLEERRDANPDDATIQIIQEKAVPNANEVHEKEEEEESLESAEEEEGEVIKRAPGRPRILRTGQIGRPKKQYHTLNVLDASKLHIPQSVEEAECSGEKNFWKIAMQEEYNALVKNNTWTLEQLPDGATAIGCRWVFTIKPKLDGSVDRFKARLVAKGCSQKQDVNYFETFSPVVRYSTIRLIIALAAEKNLYMHQMDVVTAYLNSTLTDLIYMRQPKGFINDKFPNHVLKLNKTLYGLKQSGRLWNLKLDEILKKLNFEPTQQDACLYKSNTPPFMLIAVYVDDLLLASECEKKLTEIKIKIAMEIDVVDKGAAKLFLGIEIEQNLKNGTVSICQTNYIKNLLDRYNMSNCRTTSTPLPPGFQVYCGKEDCRRVNVTSYQKIIGELLYLSVLTRPDIAHSVNKLSQKCKDPHTEHDAAAKHILRYLAETYNKNLVYMKTGKRVTGYVDADWANDESDRRSYTGFAFLYAGAVFSWETRKQQTTALSSTEAEYIALSTAAKEATYLKTLTANLDINADNMAILVFGDNLGAQHLTKNPVYHTRTKHIDVKVHHVREVVQRGDMQVEYIPTEDMLADIFTKNLCKAKHLKFCQMMGIV